MIFGRKNTNADEPGEENVTPDEVSDAVETEEPATAATDAEAAEGETADTGGLERDWDAFDLSQDWREEGPFDIDEVDLEADDVQRLDFGALVVTPPPNCEIRLQVAEGTQTIVSILIVIGESALELSAFAAPRTPGYWAEIRNNMHQQLNQGEGAADFVEGPFGTEVISNLPVLTPEGQRMFQPSRTWAVEGPRWLLRGVLLGRAALSDAVDDDVVGPLFDAFCDVVVRRGDNPLPVGDLLPMTLPPQATAQELPQEN
ncbi:MAG: DUF3710 domain-containing protein [Propionibacteriaceae bacterium]|nr:DUF3710 domain-containing protein [Propionibacteriaceae bacterium]